MLIPRIISSISMMILQYLSDMKTKTKKIKLKLVTGYLLLVKEDMKNRKATFSYIDQKDKRQIFRKTTDYLKMLKKLIFCVHEMTVTDVIQMKLF